MRLRQQLLVSIAIMLTGIFIAGFFLMQSVAQKIGVRHLGLWLLIVCLVVGLLLSFWGIVAVQRIIKRLRLIQESTQRMVAGNYKTVIDIMGHDEISDLMQAINVLTNQLASQEQEFETQEARRKELLADASHELRTPLTTISGIAEGLQYSIIAEEDRMHAYDMIKNEANRLARLVRHNLDYARFQQNQITLKRQMFDIVPLINTVIEQLSDKAALANDHIVFETVSKIMVQADRDYLTQILYNIVNNAIQFTANGTITIEIWREVSQVGVRVSDTGIGMTPTQVAKIWERYYKADPARTQTGETGLGLAITRQLVEAHHGKIEVQSEYGQGTIFSVMLPNLPENE